MLKIEHTKDWVGNGWSFVQLGEFGVALGDDAFNPEFQHSINWSKVPHNYPGHN